MIEIKAYFRPERVDAVLEALENAGARDLTLLRADAFGPMADFEADRHHFVRKYAERYSRVVKLELVCRDENAARFAEVIRSHAHTGEHGDGRIFITPVEHAVNIRTGRTGSEAL